MLLSWFHLLVFLVSVTTVLATIPTIKSYALKLGQVERPSVRRVSRRPMVRLGGISICAGTLFAILIARQFGAFATVPDSVLADLWLVLIGSFGFFLIGLADDLLSLSPITRLIAEIGIASWLWSGGVRIEFLSAPGSGLVHVGWLSLPLTIIWIAGVVNAINWIDGLDGLASGVSGIAALITFIICLFTGQFAITIVAAALVGSLLGFLYYNFNPAQIFMGDGGSYFIGSIIAGMSIVGLVKSATAVALVLPLLVLAVPIVDMSVVIVSRLWDGKSPFTADQRHLHHRLLKAGLPHRLTVVVIYALALWVGSLAIALAQVPNSWLILVSATGLLGCATFKAWQAIQQS